MKRPSFLERLTGSADFDAFEEHEYEETGDSNEVFDDTEHESGAPWEDEPAAVQEGELPIDMYQTGDAITIRALVAGVNPGNLDIAITREMVTIKGHREEVQEAPDENYYHRELFWGAFSRTILLPEEILIDEAEAIEKHGLLEIRLPKIDKERSARLKVKVGSGK